MPVLDVAVGEDRRRAERLVGDRAAVVGLVAVAEAAQDLDRVVHRRLVDADLLEAPLEGGVALEVLAVLVERRRADRLQLAAGERRLEDRRCVDRALGRAGADEIVELVDEQDDVAALGDLLHHLLQALLELAAVLRARHERGQVERVDLLVLQELRNLVRGDPGGEALDDGGLADAGLADQHRVVLRAAREDLHHALDLRLAPDDRVELALGGELREVPAELVEQLRALGLLAGGRAAALLPASGAGEHADDLVPDLLRVGVEVEQDAGGDALVLPDEAEEDVLRADVVVPERQGLAQRELQHLLRARGERDLPGRHLVALADDARDLGAHLLHRDVQALEHARGKALLLTEEAEEDVLRADVVVLEGAGLVLGENDDLPGSLGEALEQPTQRPFQSTAGPMVSNRSGVPAHAIESVSAPRRRRNSLNSPRSPASFHVPRLGDARRRKSANRYLHGWEARRLRPHRARVHGAGRRAGRRGSPGPPGEGDPRGERRRAHERDPPEPRPAHAEDRPAPDRGRRPPRRLHRLRRLLQPRPPHARPRPALDAVRRLDPLVLARARGTRPGAPARTSPGAPPASRRARP